MVDAFVSLSDPCLCRVSCQVSYVEAGQRYGIIEAVIHLVNRDFVALAELYKRLGFIPEDQVGEGCKCWHPTAL